MGSMQLLFKPFTIDNIIIKMLRSQVISAKSGTFVWINSNKSKTQQDKKIKNTSNNHEQSTSSLLNQEGHVSDQEHMKPDQRDSKTIIPDSAQHLGPAGLL